MGTLNFPRVTLELAGHVATLTLNHPEVLNATSPQMLEGLAAALAHVATNCADVRCLVLTGAGRAFCAGANLQGRGDGSPLRDAGAALETQYHPVLRRLRDLHCPVVTAVNGAAAGVGMSLAMMGDLVLAARSAYFLQAFRRIGLVPDGGSTWLLPRRVGMARALELSLLGEKLPADKALEWGLVNRVHDDADLMPQAKKFAEELAAGPTLAMGLMRRLYRASSGNSFEEQLDAECQAQRIAGRSADFREGVAAFLEKRPARFRGE